MKKILWLILTIAVGLALGVASCEASTPANAPQTFTGLFTLPDGSLLNGFFTIGLQGSTFKNICVSPYQVVPTVKKTYQVKAGVIQGISAAAFTSQDCLTPRLPYVVQLADASNTPMYADNWYLPRVDGNTIDVGTMAAEGLKGGGGSPIQVALPLGIISTPSQSQTITQPAGTSFTFIGAVIFDGPVTFEDGFTFTKVIASQVLVGGITTSSYPLDVQGVIDATGGYAVNGNGGTLGQCLVSNGTSFVPGTCTPPAFPQLYNQYLQLNGSALPQENTVNFNGSVTASTDPVNSITSFTLTETGPGNYLASVAAPLSGGGCAQGTGDGGFALLSGPCLTGTSMVAANVTGTRALGSVYQNISGRPVTVYVTSYTNATFGSGWGTTCQVGTTSTALSFFSTAGVHNDGGQATVICEVPSQSYYSVSRDDSYISNPIGPTLLNWAEVTH